MCGLPRSQTPVRRPLPQLLVLGEEVNWKLPKIDLKRLHGHRASASQPASKPQVLKSIRQAALKLLDHRASGLPFHRCVNLIYYYFEAFES